ncbi:MAG: ceramidase domain-containing protein [Pseudomonadota bacterium]
MDWTEHIDAYCERTDPSYWSEPINAVTNAAFLIAAVIMWRRCEGLVWGRVLAFVLGMIGIGSYLFHTHAQPWAALLDVTPIMMYALTYIFLANRDFWGCRPWIAALGAAAYIPYSMALTPLFEALPFFSISSFYWPLPTLIFAYAFLLRNRATDTALNLAIGAAILCVSLTARSIDEPLCAAIPLGTHFLWHILNGIMLGWMIETWRRHVTSSAHKYAGEREG